MNDKDTTLIQEAYGKVPKLTPEQQMLKILELLASGKITAATAKKQILKIHLPGESIFSDSGVGCNY